MRWLLRRRALRRALPPDAAEDAAPLDPRLAALLRSVAVLPVEQEIDFVSAAHALAAAKGSDEEWASLRRRAEEEVLAARDRHAQAVVLVEKLRVMLDQIRRRLPRSPEESRRRWLQWLRAAAESIDAARPRDDVASLRSLLIEARDVLANLPAAEGTLPGAEEGANGLESLRGQARGWIDEIHEDVRRLPSADETRMLARLRRLQAQLASLFAHRDSRALRILILHLEDLRDDIRRKLLAEGARQTTAGLPDPGALESHPGASGPDQGQK